MSENKLSCSICGVTPIVGILKDKRYCRVHFDEEIRRIKGVGIVQMCRWCKKRAATLNYKEKKICSKCYFEVLETDEKGLGRWMKSES